ncbi:MAG TPA: hypothetical protein ENI07_19440 [Desulfobacterales bacterium]|nr:hypothetical protein [Desulfobacterales bacterium]
MEDKKWIISEPEFEADVVCPMFRSWPWHGHRRFTYDLIRFVQPSRLVELGTYWGTSFFAFCQAIKDFNLPTQCIAVDSWEGDTHTQKYGQEVFDNFMMISKNSFSKLDIVPLKMLFTEAMEHVENDSVDILHIDGCHDYDAVAEDYNTWLAKLKKNGIVLFHDVADTGNYGSVKFWKDISRKKEHFTFQHSFGLGILFPKGDKIYQCMNENSFEDKMRFYESRSELDLATDKIGYLQKRLEEFQETFNKGEKRIEGFQEAFNKGEKRVEGFQEAFNKGEDMLKNYLEAFKWAEGRIVVSDSIINEKLKGLAEKEAAVIAHKKEIDENCEQMKKHIDKIQYELSSNGTKIIDLQNRLQEALDRIEKTTETIPFKIKRLLSRKATFKD